MNLADDPNIDDPCKMDARAEPQFITWISPPDTERNKLQDITVAMGNDVSTGFIYCSPYLTVDIPGADDRE